MANLVDTELAGIFSVTDVTDSPRILRIIRIVPFAG